jgi:hypothetical protein
MKYARRLSGILANTVISPDDWVVPETMVRSAGLVRTGVTPLIWRSLRRNRPGAREH